MPALALPCALQGFYCVPLHRLNMYLRINCRKKLLNPRGCSLIQYAVQQKLFSLRKQNLMIQSSNSQKLKILRSSAYRGNLIPKTARLSQKEALRESNFKRYGRRRVYTHRKFDSQNGPFEPESSFTGIKFQEVW